MSRYLFGEIDDNTLVTANRIVGTVPILQSINLSRLNFLYSAKPAKVGNTFALGSVLQPSALENSINPSSDFIITIYEPVWNKLPEMHQMLQLEKLLYLVAVTNLEKSGTANSKDYLELWRYMASEKYIKSSEFVSKLFEQVRM